MAKKYVDCAEVVGKTVKALKLYDSLVDGYETLIEFTDGTSFSSSVRNSAAVKATLFKESTGSPEVIRDYSV